MQTSGTPGMVKDTCMSACKIMKLLSKQLLVLSTTYEKMPLESSCVQIYETMGVVIESTRKIQDSMIKSGNAINEEILESGIEEDVFPDEVSMCLKEYNLLTSVFKHHLEIQNDNINSFGSYSLFSSPLLYTPSQEQ